MKDLLRITLISEETTKIEIDLNEEDDGQILSAALLAILLRDEVKPKAAILAAVAAFIGFDKEEMAEAAARATIDIGALVAGKPVN